MEVSLDRVFWAHIDDHDKVALMWATPGLNDERGATRKESLILKKGCNDTSSHRQGNLKKIEKSNSNTNGCLQPAPLPPSGSHTHSGQSEDADVI